MSQCSNPADRDDRVSQKVTQTTMLVAGGMPFRANPLSAIRSDLGHDLVFGSSPAGKTTRLARAAVTTLDATKEN